MWLFKRKHELSVKLALIEQGASRLLFEVTFENLSRANLLFPYPQIHHLKFLNQIVQKESLWYTDRLVSTLDCPTITLWSGEQRRINFSMRPCAVEPPTNSVDVDYNYHCWCVDAPKGEYAVRLLFQVDKDFFCPDSHADFRSLKTEAKQKAAVVWTGRVESNSVVVEIL